MKQFRIEELLIYNPTLTPTKKKAVEIDVQQAKIMAFYPKNSPLEQKCNSVGMAEGVYQFVQSLSGVAEAPSKAALQLEIKWQPRALQYTIMDTCCLILKEVQEDIWIFMKLDHEKQKSYHRLGNEEDEYIQSSFDEQICERIVSHIHRCLSCFHGKIGKFLFQEQLPILQKVLNYFVVKYEEIFKLEECLDVVSYILPDIRSIPLDPNSTLKFQYFKNVMHSYDPNIKEIIVFSKGYLTFSSLPKHPAEFLENYLFATGEPYRFEDKRNRFKKLQIMPNNELEKFGTIFNSRVLGFADKEQSQEGDLLGVESQHELFEVHLAMDEAGHDISVYRLNFFSERDFLFLTFYADRPPHSQLIFQNRFYHDNLDKFTVKINEALGSALARKDPYLFLFHNSATFTGKSTIRDWSSVGPQLAYALRVREEGVMATAFGQHWVYAIRRLCRLLLILIPNELPLQKLDQFVTKFAKEYLLKAFI